MKKALMVIFTIITPIIITGLLLEGGARVFYRISRGEEYNSEAIKRELQYDKLFGLGAQPKCDWLRSLYLHPQYGFFQHDQKPCGWPMSNIHTFGESLPAERGSHYTIIVLGGSVAQHIAFGIPGQSRNRIEDELNHRFLSPTGKPFRVVSGASGSWKHPSQMIKLLEFIGEIDAFISVEGYNEVSSIVGNYRIETPGLPFFILAKLPDTNTIAMSFLENYKTILDRYSVLGNSIILTRCYLALRNIFAPSILKSVEDSYLMSTYRYPPEWDNNKRIETGIAKYVDYIKALDGISLAHQKPGIFFMQPIPGLYKKLHSGEWPTRQGVATDLYEQVEKTILKQKFLNLKTHSLLKIYENVSDLIYIDDIHAKITPPLGDSLGYDIMAKNIVDAMAKNWKLKPVK